MTGWSTRWSMRWAAMPAALRGRMAAHGEIPATMARLAALDHARHQIAASVAPLLALEALMVNLARGT